MHDILQCKTCGYRLLPRSEKPPVRCPKCGATFPQSTKEFVETTFIPPGYDGTIVLEDID